MNEYKYTYLVILLAKGLNKREKYNQGVKIGTELWDRCSDDNLPPFNRTVVVENKTDDQLKMHIGECILEDRTCTHSTEVSMDGDELLSVGFLIEQNEDDSMLYPFISKEVMGDAE